MLDAAVCDVGGDTLGECVRECECECECVADDDDSGFHTTVVAQTRRLWVGSTLRFTLDAFKLQHYIMCIYDTSLLVLGAVDVAAPKIPIAYVSLTCVMCPM